MLVTLSKWLIMLIAELYQAVISLDADPSRPRHIQTCLVVTLRQQLLPGLYSPASRTVTDLS